MIGLRLIATCMHYLRGLRPSRWVMAGTALTLVAGLAAYAATSATTGSAAAVGGSPKSASPAAGAPGIVGPAAGLDRAAAAAAGQLPPETTVTLITGDKARLTTTPGGGQTVAPVLTSGKGTADFTEFTLRGDEYLIPDEAVPYLGTLLDPRLFDVSYLARAKLDDAHAKTLPVTISYTGAAPAALPGIRITHAAAGVASATITKAQAPGLGRLLASHWRQATRTRAGTAQLPGIIRISLAQPAGGPPLPSSPFQPGGQASPQGSGSSTGGHDLPYYTLTLNITGTDGTPGTAIGFVQNVDDASLELFGAEIQGSESFSVPAGTYSIGFSILTPHQGTALGYDAALVTRPQVSVHSDETLTLDARTAVPYQATLTPPAGQQVPPVQEDTLSFIRSSLAGGALGTTGVTALELGLISVSGAGYAASALSATPTAPVSTGVFGFDADSMLTANLAGSGQTPQPAQPTYTLDFPHAGSVPSSLDYTVAAKDLTTVNDQIYDPPSGGPPADGADLPVLTFNLYQRWGSGVITSAITPQFAVEPGSRTDYWYTSAPSVDLWQSYVLAPGFPGDGAETWGAVHAIRPGGQVIEIWDKGPMVAAPAASGEQGESVSSTLCPACRQDDNATLYVMPFGDSDPSHYGDPSDYQFSLSSSPVSFYRNGTLALTSGTAYGLYLPLLGAPASYRLDWSVTRVGDPAATTDTDWTFNSAPGTGPAAPQGEQCEPDPSRGCSVLPLLFLNYDLPLNFQSQAVAGQPLRVLFTVSHQQGEAAPSGVSATVSASFDDGTTWSTPQPAASLGGDQFAVTVSQPALASTGGFASLRVTARDGAGDSVTQTIIRAYGLTG